MNKQAISDKLNQYLESSSFRNELVLERCNFLDLDNELFVELVVHDGSRLAEAESVMARFKGELANEHIDIDYVVRAVWRVKTVQFAGQAILPSGEPLPESNSVARWRRGLGKPKCE